MANETIITIIGNLVRDPELRYTQSGQAVANLTIASTPRTFDKNTNEWKDGEALFLDCSVWQKHAENVAETLTKGMRVIIQGRLKQRSYEHDGQKRTKFELDIDEIGPALRYATAKVERAAFDKPTNNDDWAPKKPAAADPWATPAPPQKPAYVQDDIDSVPPF